MKNTGFYCGRLGLSGYWALNIFIFAERLNFRDPRNPTQKFSPTNPLSTINLAKCKFNHKSTTCNETYIKFLYLGAI